MIPNHLNSLPNNNDSWTGPNSKYLQTTNFNVGEIMLSVFDRVENIVGGKGENACYQHFPLFPHIVFKGLFSQGR